MSKDGAAVKMARPGGPEAVRTTIVGGRPPAEGTIPRNIPRGIEVLIKKASVDPAFKDILFEKRAGAADAIGLKLTAAEEAMLAAAPLAQLEGIVAHTRVNPKLRPAFLGYAAGAMLAALGTAITVWHKKTPPSDSLTQNEDLMKDMIVEKTISILEMPTAGIRPTVHDEKGYVVYVAGDGANDEKRRIGYLQDRMKPVLGFVKSEYDDYISANPRAKEGNIIARYTVTADGHIKNPRIISDSIGAPSVRACVLQRLAVWKIHPIKYGDVEVVYKFNFGQRRSYPSTGVVLPEAYPTRISIAEILESAGVKIDRRGGSGLEPPIRKAEDPHDRTVPEHSIAEALALNSPEAGNLDGIAEGIKGLGIRPDIPERSPRIRAGSVTATRKYISVSAPAPSSVTGPGADLPERAPVMIASVIRAQLGVITDSYKSALAENPELDGGKIMVRFTISSIGQVEDVKIEMDTLGNAEVAGTVVSIISGSVFLPVEEGPVSVAYPFGFIFEGI